MSHFLSPMQNEELITSEQTSNGYTHIKEINIVAALALSLLIQCFVYFSVCMSICLHYVRAVIAGQQKPQSHTKSNCSLP